jgi:hypothetical protein
MKNRIQNTLGVLAFVAAAAPFALVSAPASQAEDNCDYNYFWNSATNQCQFCDTDTSWWNYETNVCLLVDPTPYVDPILGPVGPVGVGPDPIVGPVGPVGVGGVGPVVGPVGPVGVGGLGPVAGPVGPVGIGR